ncbi:MAG: septum formation inhibitor Maf [Leptospirales bacterium]|nr:septum formation inhibitor Maf [Leptospirales bacterium]
MHQKTLVPFLLVATCALYSGCAPLKPAKPLSAEFNSYWNAGKAELSRYELTQARYGNLNHGELITIMVTEPFLEEKQVKADGPGDVAVLKAHTVRRFTTGIYDYTMMTSSFKPLDEANYDRSLKITATSLDWCGHTFMQLNLRSGAYRVQSRSYFESEGDQDFSLTNAVPEDEIWQRIRMDPRTLPVGDVSLIPSAVSARLRHRPLAAEKASATITDYGGSEFKGARLREYHIVYAQGGPEERVVQFIFEEKFPYKIVGLKETYMDGFEKPRKLTTIAILKKQIMLDYWRTHNPEHSALRTEFGLGPFGGQ